MSAAAAEASKEKLECPQAVVQETAQKAATPAAKAEVPPPKPPSSLKSCLRVPTGPAQAAPRRQGKTLSVSFQQVVDVNEYVRRLGGGGGMPSDGSWVSLGLGEKRRSLKEPLAPEAPGAAPPRRRGVALARKRAAAAAADAFSVVPMGKRVRLLKEAMGLHAYQEKLAKDKAEVLRLRVSREQSTATITQADLMPSSLQQARARAIKVAQEAKMQYKPVPAAKAGKAAPAGSSGTLRRRPAAAVPGAHTGRRQAVVAIGRLGKRRGQR